MLQCIDCLLLPPYLELSLVYKQPLTGILKILLLKNTAPENMWKKSLKNKHAHKNVGSKLLGFHTPYI